ncbi:MAG: ABC transporter permease [Chloroflexi bacterium]|nr:ABC transporter permease [Chloroflexota bacterium]
MKILKSYTLRVILQGILTIWAVITFTFFLIRLMPGNPIQLKIDELMQRQGLTEEEARNQAATLFEFDPDEPLTTQYVNYIGRLLQGDLGKSISSARTPVSQQLLKFLPWTLFSVGMGLFISFSIGVTIGLAMAYWRGGWLDNIFTIFASVIYGIPDYVIALLIIMVLGVQLKILPFGEMLGGSTQGITPGFTFEYIADLIKHALLPVITYVLSSVGGWILTMKSSTISTLGEDYITVARARGLSERRLLTAYVGRNAMLPLVTRLAISIGFVVGGSAIIETLFLYPGLGRNLVLAIGARDYTTMQGIFLVIAVSVVVSNILADLLFGMLDPRVRLTKDPRSK